MARYGSKSKQKPGSVPPGSGHEPGRDPLRGGTDGKVGDPRQAMAMAIGRPASRWEGGRAPPTPTQPAARKRTVKSSSGR